MANRWVGVTVDCVDVERVAAFWSVLLDRPRVPSRPGRVYLGRPPSLLLQRLIERADRVEDAVEAGEGQQSAGGRVGADHSDPATSLDDAAAGAYQQGQPEAVD